MDHNLYGNDSSRKIHMVGSHRGGRRNRARPWSGQASRLSSVSTVATHHVNLSVSTTAGLAFKGRKITVVQCAKLVPPGYVNGDVKGVKATIVCLIPKSGSS